MDFKVMKQAVGKQFADMARGDLFRVTVDGHDLWDKYLASFPEGTNPIYRERTEHDCSACRHFIRAMGGVVAITDDHKIETIWDIKVDDPAYQQVADALAAMVREHTIDNLFLSKERTAGVDENREWTGDTNEGVKTWHHFFVNIPPKFVKPSDNIGPTLSDFRATHDVMIRGLKEITMDSIDTVLELIGQNSLYRGAESKHMLTEFRILLYHFQKLEEKEQELFVWSQVPQQSHAVSRIRNTAIGTLLVDLSNGVDLESAVKSFESIVAPSNYKRPTALVTKSMVENAKKTVADLGLSSALDRRYATIDDVDTNNFLFVDRDTALTASSDPFDQVSTVSNKKLDKVEEISISDFLANVLPTVRHMEVLVENSHSSNMVSLITASDATAGNLFKWPNPFSWTYNGDVTDSIKERVKKAGGNVTGDLCCRLSWFNFDDLDLHLVEPTGHHIYYSNKKSPSGGQLDVDMNAGGGHTRNAVENIFYQNERQMPEGDYVLKVHNFAKREDKDVGFDIEIDFKGEVHSFHYDKAVRDHEYVIVARFRYTRGRGIEFTSSLPKTTASRTIWGIATQDFTPVSAVMLSPNFWREPGIGNKHFFFMLKGCQNIETSRGFYNEFLREDLTPHRKVLEMVGSKVRVQETPNQLSGVGFSSTQRNHLVCKLTGAFTRVVKIIF